jgi:hypothetical protein
MKITRLFRHAVFGLGLAASTAASAAYSQLYVFGDSLSDVGNNAIALPLVLGPGVTPDAAIGSNDFIPSTPTAPGATAMARCGRRCLPSSWEPAPCCPPWREAPVLPTGAPTRVGWMMCRPCVTK